jgi:methyltransferase-like protein
MLADHDVFSKSSGFISRVIEDEVVLVPSPSPGSQIDSVYSINPCGAFIWNLLDGSHSVKVVIEAVVQEFDVTQETVASDVREFLESLLAEGLILPNNETQPPSSPTMGG